MLGVVINDFVVNLVGEYDQLVLFSQPHDLFKDFLRIYCSGRIVGINNHDALCVGCDFSFQIFQVG